uniref:Uncharacterized protein n=1 Tax=Engystomops pustulosus TaxID=76066 RepID=A0AAV6YZM8_ENGPU|nr:hypothetical protein GDO81_019021 [Engystomops pustulosus]
MQQMCMIYCSRCAPITLTNPPVLLPKVENDSSSFSISSVIYNRRDSALCNCLIKSWNKMLLPFVSIVSDCTMTYTYRISQSSCAPVRTESDVH